jgi:uroporphyrinogen-III decarboxylase
MSTIPYQITEATLLDGARHLAIYMRLILPLIKSSIATTTVEAGLDILNPVQISADNMDPWALKKEFGDSLSFWGGGCDTQRILGFRNVEEVRKNTRELCDIFKPCGGFVFNQVHNIMGNVPPENITAMFDEAYKNSFYPEPVQK